jgi:transposase-like protein
MRATGRYGTLGNIPETRRRAVSTRRAEALLEAPCPACQSAKPVFTYVYRNEQFYLCSHCEQSWSVVRSGQTDAIAPPQGRDE